MNRKREGLFGVNPVLEALRAGDREFDKVYIAKGTSGRGVGELVEICRGRNVPVHFENREILDRIAGTKKHQGIYGVVGAKGYSSEEEILEIARRKKENLCILLVDSVEDPRNLGAIIRTAEAAGVHGIIIPKHRSAGLTDIVAKTSAGAIEHIKIARVANLLNSIDWLKKKGVWIYGLDMAGEKEYNTLSYSFPLAVVVGGEGRGIREAILKACDVRVRIPLFGQTTSLNVSVATGIILFEMAKYK